MRVLSVFALLVSLIVCGCSGGRSVEGKWNITPSQDMPPGSTMAAEFNGGNMTMTMDMPQPLPDGKKIELHADIKGTYTLEGEKMTMKAEDVKFSGKGFPPELKSMFDSQMKTMGDQVKTKLNEEGSVKFAWVDDNTFTLTGKSGKPETFKRAK